MKKSFDLDLINQLQHEFEAAILEGDIAKYMIILKKKPDGSWKYWRVIHNLNPPSDKN